MRLYFHQKRFTSQSCQVLSDLSLFGVSSELSEVFVQVIFERAPEVEQGLVDQTAGVTTNEMLDFDYSLRVRNFQIMISEFSMIFPAHFG
jgi:hypothetical protein